MIYFCPPVSGIGCSFWGTLFKRSSRSKTPSTPSEGTVSVTEISQQLVSSSGAITRILSGHDGFGLHLSSLIKHNRDQDHSTIWSDAAAPTTTTPSSHEDSSPSC